MRSVWKLDGRGMGRRVLPYYGGNQNKSKKETNEEWIVGRRHDAPWRL